MPSVLKIWRFAKQYYEDYFSRPVCRLCDTRSRFEEAVAEDTRTRLEEVVAEGNNRYTELKNRFDTLQEFVSANIGRSATTDSLPHTSVATADSRSRPFLSPDPAFIPVRNGARRDVRRTHLPLTTYNHFSILSEQVEEAQKTRLVGDSIVRGQLEEFCGRVPSRRRRYCLPGATLCDITDCVEDELMTSTAPVQKN
ncbi:hypothetical protein E2C01_093721 [Portunus trituberculatus]|uniref:Uncharacterized protein n=1 Tax=Portunus trituberculatus TaxID=210409 RepID=A0A5B7K158_PORTR|nr:hypothetical protein [Portunus trituberculatus]